MTTTQETTQGDFFEVPLDDEELKTALERRGKAADKVADLTAKRKDAQDVFNDADKELEAIVARKELSGGTRYKIDKWALTITDVAAYQRVEVELAG